MNNHYGTCPTNDVMLAACIEEHTKRCVDSKDDAMILSEIARMLEQQQTLLTKTHLKFSTTDRFLSGNISLFCHIRQVARWNVGAMVILHQKITAVLGQESMASLCSILEKNAVALDLLERAGIVLNELQEGKSHNIYQISNKRLVRKYLKQADHLAARANKQIGDFETTYFVPHPRKTLPWIFRPLRFLLSPQAIRALTEQ